MPQVLLIAAAGAPPVAEDLAALGVRVVARCAPAQLVAEAVRSAADVVLAWEPYPADVLLPALATLQQQAPRPVLLFTDDADAGTLAAALDSGVHAYVVQGYAPARLRPLLQLAQARFAREAAQRSAHAELSDRFEERKLVERAKGILMRSQQISEDEAFRQLRQASMLGHQRVGQVSRRVIDTARDTDAIDRAGRLRMLSQRLVALYALRCDARGTAAAEAAAARQHEAEQRVAELIAGLGQALSRPTYGDLLEAVERAWAALRSALQPLPRAEQLPALDRAADDLLAAADALTTSLEAVSPVRSLTVVNRAGRQRMLSQRLAKQALLGSLCEGAPAQAAVAEAARSLQAFEEALQRLQQAPLSSPEIRAGLEAAQHEWQALRSALAAPGDAGARERLAAAAERLLERFEQLTRLYVHAAQALLEPG